MSETSWIFVEDMEDEGKAFAERISDLTANLAVRPVLPVEARQGLLSGAIRAAGVLMDIELSAVAGELGTGLGLAQDIRAKQRSQEIAEFPVIRFARLEPVAKNVGGDTSSEDLFDLRVDKDTARTNVDDLRNSMLGVKAVYESLGQARELNDESFGILLGLSEQERELWSHPGLQARLADGRQFGIHVSAGTFMRSLLLVTGPLIDEYLLAVRLGVDIDASTQWKDLLSLFESFRFKGAGSRYFRRWWARGLEEWWLSISSDGSSLASLSIGERIEILSSRDIAGLIGLKMPPGSAGDRPWRFCSLALESDAPERIPVDPAASVRITPRTDLPPWIDAAYASLGNALRNSSDLRLNKSDVQRLKAKYG